MAVVADFVVDFTGIADTSPYTNPDLLQVGLGAVKIEAGSIKPVSSGTSRRVMFGGEVTQRVRALVKTETAGSFDYIVPGIFNDDGSGFFWWPNSGKLWLKKIDTGTTVSNLVAADNSGIPFAVGDTLELDYDDATNMLRGYINGVWQIGKATDTHDGPLRPGVYVRWGNTGATSASSIGFNGVVVAGPATILDVNGGAPVTQYQQSVSTTLENMDANNVVSATLNGLPVTTLVGGTSAELLWHAPGSLASGTYTLEISTATETITADVDYTRTHPIQVPPAGTVVDPDSIFGQMGNPGGRYISVTKPAALTWKAPHNSFTAANCALDISDLLEAPSDAPADQSYDITGSLIDPDGITQAFTIAATVDLAEEPVDPPPVDPDWPFGLNLSWLAPGNWTWGGRHPKTNQRIRKWMGQ